MNYELYVSILLIIISISIYLNKNYSPSNPHKIIFSFGIFISTFSYIVYSIADYFTGKGITPAVIYYVKYGLSGTGFSEYKGLITYSVLSAVLGILFSLWLLFRKTTIKQTQVWQTYLILFLLALSIIFNPVTSSLADFNLKEITEPTFDTSSEFYQYYTTPTLARIDQPKNFVFIYAESLERTYFNQTLFPNLTPNLLELESQSITFTNVYQDAYSDHTIAGNVAGQCGFPLISPSHSNAMSGMDTYLKSATCLGDLLHQEGYYLTRYLGEDKEFAGTGKFYRTHKFDEVKGKYELLPKLENQMYLTAWGLYDDTLFNFAYAEFITLSENEKKFGLFLSTLDTHPPYGNPSATCKDIKYQDGKNLILNAAACSDKLISEFIKSIRQSPYSNNTIIILISDHLALPNTATKILEYADRRNLFLINEPGVNPGEKVTTPGLTIDIGSTILSFIGYHGEIGLGRDLYHTPRSENRVNELLGKLSDFKPSILQFWNFPTIHSFIKIDTDNNIIFIDQRELKIPIIIELNDRLETELHFEFTLPDDLGLHSQLPNMDEQSYFLLIEECSRANSILTVPIEYKGMCLVSGTKQKYHATKISASTKITIDEIRKITGMPTH